MSENAILNYYKLIINTGSMTTRHIPNLILFKKISEWQIGSDIDDYIDITDNNGNLTINYKILVELLVLLQGNLLTEQCEKINLDLLNNKEIINAYLKECNSKLNLDIKICIIKQIQIIIKLYDDIKLLPIVNNINNIDKNKNIILYRGFNYTRYEDFFKLININNISINNQITTPTFLSTSVLEIISQKFVSISNPENLNESILWKIIVKPEYYSTFIYSYLGNDINIIQIEKIIDSNEYECELLLNIGAKLKCINIENINFEGYNYGSLIIPQKKYKIYTFEFIGWDKIYTRNLISSLNNFIKCLELKTKKRKSSSSKSSSSKSLSSPDNKKREI